ncbi:MAG: decaprenylphospho-beta-D-erythro-pentofuranosid-2-ulose 2-reductase [Acidimicrobiales bacterium]|nr:decaprenylphospho-beta-D-erythro-pentofuranosid-2-ulose 2-reductase [Acidimicrobiales bacterium]
MRDAVGGVQSVLVLGGTSEIALATVRRMVDQGCRTVLLAARNPDDCLAAAAAVREAGATTVDTLAFDALDTASHGTVIDEAFTRHGDLDVVLLAFGVLGDQAEFEADPAKAVAAVQVNYVGAVSAGLHVARNLRRQGHGTLVVLSSVAGERVRKTNFVYGSSKAGLDGFAQGLGDSLVGTGASVLVVRPGFVHTRMTEGMEEQPFTADPDEVAEAAADGLAKGQAVVWAPAPLRLVMSGLRHLPRPLWRKASERG